MVAQYLKKRVFRWKVTQFRFFFFSLYHEDVKSWQRNQKSECARSF